MACVSASASASPGRRARCEIELVAASRQVRGACGRAPEARHQHCARGEQGVEFRLRGWPTRGSSACSRARGERQQSKRSSASMRSSAVRCAASAREIPGRAPGPDRRLVAARRAACAAWLRDCRCRTGAVVLVRDQDALDERLVVDQRVQIFAQVFRVLGHALSRRSSVAGGSAQPAREPAQAGFDLGGTVDDRFKVLWSRTSTTQSSRP